MARPISLLSKEDRLPGRAVLLDGDGKRKETPDYIVLKETLGKSGDTICPVCGRIVLGHNPAPDESVPLETPTSAPAKDNAPTAAPTTQPAD